MVFSLHLVNLSTAACISEKINLGPCWRKDFKGSKVKHKSQNVTFCELSLLLLVYLSAVSFITVEISLGSCWRGDILRAEVRINYKLQLFMSMQSSSGNYSMRHRHDRVPTVF